MTEALFKFIGAGNVVRDVQTSAGKVNGLSSLTVGLLCPWFRRVRDTISKVFRIECDHNFCFWPKPLIVFAPHPNRNPDLGCVDAVSFRRAVPFRNCCIVQRNPPAIPAGLPCHIENSDPDKAGTYDQRDTPNGFHGDALSIMNGAVEHKRSPGGKQ